MAVSMRMLIIIAVVMTGYLCASVSNHTIRNVLSARISVPSLFVPSESSTDSLAYKWRTPLHTTAPYWEGMPCFLEDASLLTYQHVGLTRMVQGPLKEIPSRANSKTPRSGWNR